MSEKNSPARNVELVGIGNHDRFGDLPCGRLHLEKSSRQGEIVRLSSGARPGGKSVLRPQGRCDMVLQDVELAHEPENRALGQPAGPVPGHEFLPDMQTADEAGQRRAFIRLGRGAGGGIGGQDGEDGRVGGLCQGQRDSHPTVVSVTAQHRVQT